MSVTGIITATVVVGAVGMFVGVFLGIAGLRFKVDVDEKEEAILTALPGNNCGGCGYAGCSGLAAAIAKGEAPVGGCPVGGDAVANKIAEIMGVVATNSTRRVAFVACIGDCEKANKAKLPTHIELNASLYDMDKDSVVLLEQLRTIDKKRLKDKICHLDGDIMKRVNQALKVSLELDT